MRLFITVLMVAAMATTAFAGLNPNAIGYISFDAAGAEVHRYDATPYEQVTCYVVIAEIPDGLTTANFMLTLTPGMSLMNTFTNLLPGDLAIGAYDTGIALAATSCQTADPLVVAQLLMFCAGTPGDVMLDPHPTWGYWIDGCTPGVGEDYFIVTCNGGILKDAECTSPVEDTTWGSVKALYR